ncbi:MAG: hypothetical protein K9N00_01650 [Candidatus Marinimicrobia bacterium]|nr:hypothetical protein [Candidatus Neomarinimicrobiota bacterium]
MRRFLRTMGVLSQRPL